jgi:hypothetical protein
MEKIKNEKEYDNIDENRILDKLLDKSYQLKEKIQNILQNLTELKELEEKILKLIHKLKLNYAKLIQKIYTKISQAKKEDEKKMLSEKLDEITDDINLLTDKIEKNFEEKNFYEKYTKYLKDIEEILMNAERMLNTIKMRRVIKSKSIISKFINKADNKLFKKTSDSITISNGLIIEIARKINQKKYNLKLLEGECENLILRIELLLNKN